MPTVIFRGRVLPEFTGITISLPLLVDWTSPDKTKAIHFDLSIKKGAIVAKCTVPDYETDYLQFLTKYTFGFVESAVNVVAFAQGSGLFIILDTAEEPSGRVVALYPKQDILEKEVTSYTLGAGLWEMLQIVMSDSRIFQALNDLITSIRIPATGMVDCARAIEGIRHIISPSESDRSVQWVKMRDALNLDKTYISFVIDQSKDTRHGNRSSQKIVDDDGVEALRRSWVIMNRFLEYKKRGDASLSLSEFPVLKG
jgi:hypothetical protein